MTLLHGVNYAVGETKKYSSVDGAHDLHLSLFCCFPFRSSMAYVRHPKALVILRRRKAGDWKVPCRSPFRCNTPSAACILVPLHSYGRSVNHASFSTCLITTQLTWRIWWAPNNASKRQMGFNSALPLKLDFYSLAHRLCTMWIFYEPRRVTLGNTRHFVEV